MWTFIFFLKTSSFSVNRNDIFKNSRKSITIPYHPNVSMRSWLYIHRTYVIDSNCGYKYIIWYIITNTLFAILLQIHYLVYYYKYIICYIITNTLFGILLQIHYLVYYYKYIIWYIITNTLFGILLQIHYLVYYYKYIICYIITNRLFGILLQIHYLVYYYK